MNFGFDCSFDKNSSGLVVADFSGSDNHVYLTGFIRVSEGQMEVNLSDPDGEPVYSRILVAPVEVHINEIYDARPGYWKLKYKSRGGTGYIDLHLFK
ncbi:MAG: hypothetical protein PHX54_06015 [Lentimicrobiaceae bacterium]|nr:hypothetical protein [Lentimicrobiaceae bacterium]